jgi:hypothetical protein
MNLTLDKPMFCVSQSCHTLQAILLIFDRHLRRIILPNNRWRTQVSHGRQARGSARIDVEG